MLAVPPPPPEELAQVEYFTPRQKHRRAKSNAASIGMRRTAIPPLLTMGLGLIAGGALKFLVGEDSPMHDVPVWIAIALFVVGLALIGIAVLNILQLRAMLQSQPSAK